MFVAFAIEVFCTALKFPQSRYIAAFTFGYISHVIWKDHKPRTFLKTVYEKILVAVGFAHVGGSLNLYAIKGDVLGVAFGLFILGEIARIVSMSLTSFLRCY